MKGRRPHWWPWTSSRGSGGRRWGARRWWRPPASCSGSGWSSTWPGNLTLFSGPAAADGYAAALRTTPAALWAVRAGPAAAAIVHVAGVVSLARAAGRRGPGTRPPPARASAVARADHAGGRRAAARLRRLPPAAPHRRALPPGLSPRPRLRQRGARIAAHLGRGDLRRPPPSCSASTSSTASGQRRAASGVRPEGGGAAAASRGGPGLGRGGAGLRVGAAGGARRVAAMTPISLPRTPRPDRWPRRWQRRRDELGAGRPDAPPPSLRARGGRGAGRRLRGGHAVRARLSRALPRLPRLAPARPQRGRAGRDQRRQELPERRRQRRAALPRHAGGRRLPLARGQRVPAGRAVGAHHRPRGGPGRAVRPRVRRPPRQSLVRRRAGLADVLRARADRPAAPARRLSERSRRRRRRAA